MSTGFPDHNAEVLLRPEVLALQRRAEDQRTGAEETFTLAEFWATLRTDCCEDGCEDPLCYHAWRGYPDG